VRRRPAVRALAGLAAAALGVLLVACGSLRLGPNDAAGGALARVADLGGASYVVAGGTTTEVRVLCQLTIAALQAAGARATDQCGKVGSVDVRRPARQTEVDTAWIYLGRPDRDGGDPSSVLPAPLRPPDPSGSARPGDPAEAARADAALGVTRLAPAAFGDVDAVVVGPALAGVGTVSGLADRLRLPGAEPLCATPEATADPGRLPALLEVYRPSTEVRVLDSGAVFGAVATGGCAAGLVPGTSGRIPALALTVLADDRGALARGPTGRGGAVPVLRTPVLAAHPQVAPVLATMTARLDDAALRSINRDVDQDGRDPRDAARRWLLAQGLIDRT